MAAREFRNDPRRQNLDKLNKKAELYILATANKPKVAVPEVNPVVKPTKIEINKPTRMI